MTPPVRPELADPTAAIQALKAQGAPDEAIHAYLQSKGYTPAEDAPKEGLGTRVLNKVGSGLKQLVSHPIDTVGGMAKSAAEDLGKVANSMNAGMGQPNDLTPESAKEVPGAMLRTASTLAFPGIAGGIGKGLMAKGVSGAIAKALGTAGAGGVAGMASDPSDPVAGGLAGAATGAVLHGAGKVVGAGAKGIGSAAMDVIGRPTESRPLIKAGPVSIGRVEGLGDRAASLNAKALGANGATDMSAIANPSGKPLAPVDAGIPAQRLARGLKTSSPAAEDVFRGALEPRADDAVGRVINHAKELSGIKRANAFETSEQLKQRTIDESNANYGPMWEEEAKRGVVSHPDLPSVMERPAVKHALPIAAEMQANEGVARPVGKPEGIPDDQWAMLKAAAERQGIKLPDEAGGHTLQDLHNVKLAMDDMKRTGIERGPGAGGVGYNRGKAIGSAQRALLKIMDDWSPKYGENRGIHADNKSIEKAADLGSDHWTRDPAESQSLLKDMTPGEQGVYKSNAFDKWAQRVENGPEDVSKAQSKPLNTARLKSLFPDDASFGKFQEGLKHEARMHATNKTVLSGSTTADKLSDVAGMAGVTLPEVLRATSSPSGALHVAASVADRFRRSSTSKQGNILAGERAKLLTAGANGDAAARSAAVQKMGGGLLDALKP